MNTIVPIWELNKIANEHIGDGILYTSAVNITQLNWMEWNDKTDLHVYKTGFIA